MLIHRNKYVFNRHSILISLLTLFVMSSKVLVHPPSVAWQTLLTIQKRNGDCLSVFFKLHHAKTTGFYWNFAQS